jgi:MFS family permease
LFNFLKKDFTLSDFELGLLGTVFMVVHSVASVPLGILADRWIRKRIISIGVIVWSVATFFSGLVQNFAQLLGARSVVGIGEAAYGPAATAILADKYQEESRAKVLSIFHLGMFAGGTLGMVTAGLLGTLLGWRICFFIVGIPGLILALLSLKISDSPSAHHESLHLKRSSVYSIFKLPAFNTILAGGIFLAFTSGAIISWITEFLVRYHGFTVAESAFSVGTIVLVAGLGGIYFGGYLADKLYILNRMPRSFVISLGFIIATPLLLIIVNTKSYPMLLISLFTGTFFMAWYYGPVVALIQDIVPGTLKATAYAFYIFFIHLLGDTISPSVIGKLSDISSLKTAFYLPIATNFLGGMLFLLTTYLVKKQHVNQKIH